MRSVVLAVVCLGFISGAAAATPPASSRATTSDVATASALDHVLLWGRDIDQVSAILAVKLGFQVRPGRDPAGVANRYVRMADRSYLEMLGMTRPDPTLDPGMQADQALLKGGPGARTFGLRAVALDRARARLRDLGLAPTAVFAAAPDDPDGGGPSRPPRWRLFAFERQPLSSALFFIDYAADRSGPGRAEDDRIAREHPNGARAFSAFWLLSADAEADRAQLARMGYAGATRLRLPQVAAAGYCVPIARGRLLVLQPDGPGIAADALRDGGPQVLGVSVDVADLDRAQRRVERGYETAVARYRDPFGPAFLAPTRHDLGMLIEFRAASTPANACASAASTRTRR